MDFAILFLGLILGYALSIFTWPSLRLSMIGAEAETDWLRARIAALRRKD